MNQYTLRADLQIDTVLVDFVEHELLNGLSLSRSEFWQGLSNLVGTFSTPNKILLDKRAVLQKKIDQWCTQNKDVFDKEKYQHFLQDIGYLEKEADDFLIETRNVDAEIAINAGPQLVVPTSNARFALNAANARWGNLYDALYASDVIAFDLEHAKKTGYNADRGAKVIQWGRDFLDDFFALSSGSHSEAVSYRIVGGRLQVTLEDSCIVGLKDVSVYKGYQGNSKHPNAILLQHHGLFVILEIKADSMIGKIDKAGVANIIMESALTTIQDFEDSVAAVDAQDKTEVYRNWLGLMRGDLRDTFEKNGEKITRSLASNKSFIGKNGQSITLSGRSLLLVRNVGLLMRNPAVLDCEGEPIYEGILDALMSVTAGLYDVQGLSEYQNSREGSIYIVKPKLHGAEEVAFTNRLFAAVEDIVGLPRFTVKMGIMDEERRTTVNLKACIREAKERVVFINTGFLDRTGDEIHTSMQLGAMVPKTQMKQQKWIQAYENWNVDTGLSCGFSQKAQIGKGMWAMPDELGKMLVQKKEHPLSGASTAWVPSPIGAVLHAIHYHQVSVRAQQKIILQRENAKLEDILCIPLMDLEQRRGLSPSQIEHELQNNAQGVLGYVVRWIDQGVGCSKVPDIDNVGLMEDRATLRISSQHMCNWLLHKVCTTQQVIDAFKKMAVVVDEQNQHDISYTPMSVDFDNNVAFIAAINLVLKGEEQPNGYTEPVLHRYRLLRKRR